MSNQENNINYIFEAVDPLGNPIVMTRIRWQEHIQVYHAEWLEREDALDLIKRSIELPHIITEDDDFQDTLAYYLRRNIELNIPAQYVRTYVDLSTTLGYVKTSFFSDEYVEKGKVKWIDITTD